MSDSMVKVLLTCLLFTFYYILSMFVGFNVIILSAVSIITIDVLTKDHE